MKYRLKRLNRLVGQAMGDYRMLEDGDRIMVAVSGGTDSLVMLELLKQWRAKAPLDFELVACFLDMGFAPAGYWQPLEDHLAESGIGFHLERTDIGPLAHSDHNREKSPCFLCSFLRRKRLFQLTHALSCNKLALGHNLDDIIETFFMNVCYSGELSTMVPRQEMFKGLITIIRPLAMADKPLISAVAKAWRLPVLENPCPSAGSSRRSRLRSMLQELYRENRKVRGNIRKALSNVRLDYLL